MKKLLSLCVGLFLITSLQAQLRIVEVNPTSNEITIKNFGSLDVDISTYRLCSLFDYEGLSEAEVSIANGDFILSQDEEVDIIWASLSGMDELGSDLGLYLPSGSFTDPANMVDFVQWASAGNGRESVADAAGIWVAGTFINGNAPYTYTGNGTDNGVGFWDTYVAPTSTIVINEVDADQTGSDNGEFVELYGPTNESLDGMVLVFYNGSGDVSYGAIDLDGQSLNTDGFFVLGDAGVQNLDLVMSGSIQNGADAVALYFGDDTDFPNGTALTSLNIIDALVYDTGDPDDAGLLALLNPGQAQMDENENGAGGTESNSRLPDGGTQLNTDTYVQQLPSPGCLNSTGCPVVLTPTASFLLSSQAVVEGQMVDVTVTMADSDAPYSLDISVIGGSATAVDDYNNVFPTTLNFGMGDNTPQTLSFLIVDDVDSEGDETIELELSTADAGLTLDLTAQTITIGASDQVISSSIVINEVDADQVSGDDSEFIELYGTPSESLDGMVVVLYNGSNDLSYTAVDLDGFSLNADGFFVLGDAGVQNLDLELVGGIQNGADAVALYYGDDTDFPTGTAITTSSLIDALVYDTGDADDVALLALLNPGQPQVDEGGNGAKDTESNSRLPDGGTQRNTDTYVQQLPSPGCLNTIGCPVVLNPTASFELTSQSVSEGDMVDVTVTMADSDAPYAVDVAVIGGSATAIDDYNNVFPTTLNFAMGDNTPQTISFLIVDDVDAEGDETIELQLSTADVGLTLDVIDQTITIGASDQVVSTTVVINEVDVDQTGADDFEFIELYGTPNESLDGMVVVLYNGSSDVSYNAIDLDGQSLNADGLFVIGDAGVTNVDLVMSGSIQNGADAVALYFGDDTDFPNNTPVTSSGIIDAFVYGTGDPDDAGLLALLNPGQPQVDENSNAAGGTESNARIPDGGTQLNTDTYVQQVPSPGCLNVIGCPVVLVPTASFSVSSQSVIEGQMVDVTINMADSDAAYMVDITLDGGTATAVDDFDNIFTTSLTFAMGDNTPQTVSFLIVDDVDEEGDETIILGLSTADVGLTIDVDVQTITIDANDVPTPLFDIVDVVTLDIDGVANSLGQSCELRGLVYGVNMRVGGMQFTLIDPTDGIGVYHASNDFGYTVAEGDSVHVTGTINQFNGLTQLDLSSVTLISSGNTINEPILVTALDEFSESNLVSLTCLSIVDPAEWTNSGSGFNVDVTDGTNIFSMRIDADVDVYGTDAPLGAFDLVGLGGQFDQSSPYDEGYQIFPRSLSDITPSLLGDYNNDLAVNAADLLFMLAEFGCTSDCDANLVPGPNVDAADLLAFLAVFGNSCQ